MVIHDPTHCLFTMIECKEVKFKMVLMPYLIIYKQGCLCHTVSGWPLLNTAIPAGTAGGDQCCPGGCLGDWCASACTQIHEGPVSLINQ